MSALWIAAIAAASAVLLAVSDHATRRFAANPDPRGILAVRAFGFLSVVATLGFYGTVMVAAVGIAAPLALALRKPLFFRPIVVASLLGALWFARLARDGIRAIAQHTADAGVRGSPDTDTDGNERGDGGIQWFAAMQYYALILNRTYKVFIAETMLCGANVRGAVASPPVMPGAYKDKAYWVATAAAALYEHIDLTGPTFLKLNGANFQIPWSEISWVELNVNPKWGMGNVPYSGRIILHLRSGRSRELILLGTQDGAELKRQLEHAIAASPHAGHLLPAAT